jgi:hypothetical protein
VPLRYLHIELVPSFLRYFLAKTLVGVYEEPAELILLVLDLNIHLVRQTGRAILQFGHQSPGEMHIFRVFFVEISTLWTRVSDPDPDPHGSALI